MSSLRFPRQATCVGWAPDKHDKLDMPRSALLNVMVQAATKAGRSLARDFGEVENLQVSVKGPGDFVSAADRKAEQILVAELQKARPTIGFLTEETGTIAGSDSSQRWL